MKNIKVVIGANFGDEGKGMMTDYFCGLFPQEENVLNIRFNGTSQAGHTVVRDSKRHVFSHFGAGSFLKNVHTFLSPFFFMSPIRFNEEREMLLSLGVNPVVLADEKCPIITPFDVICNCLIETERGTACHGSCGAGLWEAVCREEAGFHLPFNSLLMGDEVLAALLADIKDIYYGERFRESGICLTKDNPWYEIWNSDGLIPNYLTEIRKMQQHISVVSGKGVLNSYINQVYEGAQGLLLDWDNDEYMPNLTASYTGVKNVLSLWNLIEDKRLDAEVCYVTRTYLTRHGAGRFDTEVSKSILGTYLLDKTNKFNSWQGDLRWGYFDPELFEKTIKKDVSILYGQLYSNIRRSIAFTHVNMTRGFLLTPAGNMTVEKYLEGLSDLSLDTIYTAEGEQAKNITKINVVSDFKT